MFISVMCPTCLEMIERREDLYEFNRGVPVCINCGLIESRKEKVCSECNEEDCSKLRNADDICIKHINIRRSKMNNIRHQDAYDEFKKYGDPKKVIAFELGIIEESEKLRTAAIETLKYFGLEKETIVYDVDQDTAELGFTHIMISFDKGAHKVCIEYIEQLIEEINSELAYRQF